MTLDFCPSCGENTLKCTKWWDVCRAEDCGYSQVYGEPAHEEPKKNPIQTSKFVADEKSVEVLAQS